MVALDAPIGGGSGRELIQVEKVCTNLRSIVARSPTDERS